MPRAGTAPWRYVQKLELDLTELGFEYDLGRCKAYVDWKKCLSMPLMPSKDQSTTSHSTQRVMLRAH